MALHLVLFIALFLSSTTSMNALLQDFCVADLSLPSTPSGYPCKPADSATSDDFVFTGLRQAANISNPGKAGVNPAFVNAFPALNGLGMSVLRADMAPGGAFPIHSHPDATEMIVGVSGTFLAGFISSSTNKVYAKRLSAGDVMVLPQGLIQIVVNVGDTPATGYVFFNSPNPTVQATPRALFGNDLATAILEQVTFISPNEIKRLKAMLGGSG